MKKVLMGLVAGMILATGAQALAYARLPLQIPLIRGAWRVFRGE